MKTTESWVYDINLGPTLELLAHACGYTFDQADLDAVIEGIRRTDYERGMWFHYDLAGPKPITLSLAKDLGPSVIFIQLIAPDDLRAVVDMVFLAAQTYLISKRHD